MNIFKTLKNITGSTEAPQAQTRKIYRHLVDIKTGYYVSEVTLEGTKAEVIAQIADYKAQGYKVVKNANESNWA